MMHGNPYAPSNFGRPAKQDEEDDLYAGYDQIASTETIHKTVSVSRGGAPGRVPGAGNPFGPPVGAPAPSIRPPTQAFPNEAEPEAKRPMTAVKGAGYTSAKKVVDPLNQFAAGGASTLKPIAEKKKSPEEVARQMEQEINQLLAASSQARAQKKQQVALEKARLAVRRERQLARHRDKQQLDNGGNYLAYGTRVNLARQLHASKKYKEAVAEYTNIIKEGYEQSDRLRVNIGNIYYEQKRYPAAIKMYRMAMDKITGTTSSAREVRCRINQNIGSAFIKLGQYQEAVSAFQTVMNEHPNTQTGFNLLLCQYARGNVDKMRKAFCALVAVHNPYSADDDEDDDDAQGAEEGGDAKVLGDAESGQIDELKRDLREQRTRDERLVHQAAKLIAPAIDPSNLAAGYEWVIEQLRGAGSRVPGGPAPDGASGGYPRLATEMEIALGVEFLKRKDIKRAISVFQELENKESHLVDRAATNLSFLYFLQDNVEQTQKYAEKAVRADRYNAKALVNKANLLFKKGYLEGAKELYLEAIGVEAACVEAIYNLGLVNKRLGQLKPAIMAFTKLHQIVPKDPQVIYQIANLYESMDQPQRALDWFKTLQGTVPTDPGILYRMGSLHQKEQDDTSAFHNYSESYTVYPVNMDIISWLGVWFVKARVYEKAIPIFERAAEIEPEEIKWKLMVASCLRRMGALGRALKRYKEIHKQDPDNCECLNYVCDILKELNRDDELAEYDKLYRKAQRLQAQEQSADANRFMQDEVREDADLYQGEYMNRGEEEPPRGFSPGDPSARFVDEDSPTGGTPAGSEWRDAGGGGSDGGDDGGDRKFAGSLDDGPGMKSPKEGVLEIVAQGKKLKRKPKLPSQRGRGGKGSNARPAPKKKAPKKKKKKKPVVEDDDEEWADLDLGMEDLLPE